MTPSPPSRRRPPQTARLEYGLTVREVLKASTLSEARVLAGEDGLDRLVERMNVMEVPDILPWVKPHEFLLTTGYPLRNTPQALDQLIEDLNDRELAGLAIKTGRYLDEVPEELLQRAERLQFPIVELPKEVAFDEVLNQVLTDILNHQASQLVRADEVHRALLQIVLEGGGLAELAGEVGRHLGGLAVIRELDGTVVASSGPIEDVPTAMTPGGDPVPLPAAGDDGTGSRPARVMVPVVAGGAEHGSITWFPAQGEPTPVDVHVLEQAATVAALVVTRVQAVQAVEAKYRGDFLRDVLSGRAGSPKVVVDHARVFGWDLDRRLVVAVVEHGRDNLLPTRANPHDSWAAAWTRAVADNDRGSGLADFSHELIIVAGAPVDGDSESMVRRMAAAVQRSLADDRLVARRAVDAASAGRGEFHVGISRVAASVEELPEAYRQASRAVQVAGQIAGVSVMHFDRLGVFRLLSLIPDRNELDAFVSDVLGPVADSDHEDLRATLEVLLETSGNVAETARRLNYHYNSLRYRIAKLERLLGPFTDDPQARLQLHVALQVLKLRRL